MNNTKTEGVSGATLLFLTFLILKLTHVINWSWWWITAPVWGVVALLVVLVGTILLVKLIVVGRSTNKASKALRDLPQEFRR